MKTDQYSISEILGYIENDRFETEKKRKHSNKTVEITNLDRLYAKLKHMSKSTNDIITEHLKHLMEPKPTVMTPCEKSPLILKIILIFLRLVKSPNQDSFGTIFFKIAYESEKKQSQTVNINLKSRLNAS
jgi:hypothetical protein